MSFLPSVIVLGLVALVALRLTTARSSPAKWRSDRHAAAIALAVATLLQTIHFAEEAATSLHVALPEFFGLPGMPFSAFVAINVFWIGIWIASIFGLRSGHAGAFFAAWFLALAGMMNALAHPLLALASGGYFSGTVSAPLVGAACLWLWVKLRRATRPNGTGRHRQPDRPPPA